MHDTDFPHTKFHFFLLLFIILFTSCDVLRTIQFDNRSGKNVSIRYFIIENPDSISISEIQLPKSNEIPLKLRLSLTKREIEEYTKIKQMSQNIHILPCGINVFWTEKEIKKYITNIQKIEIITPKKVTILEREELFQYLKKNRNFYWNKIVIKIKE
jgi:hypothetical protein